MFAVKRSNAVILAAVSTIISACGGGGGSNAPETPALSANQQAYESLILAPNTGSYSLSWNLNYSGPQTSGTNFAQSSNAVMAASPLTNGPQTVQQSPWHNLTSTLALGTPGTIRILKNGVILVAPALADAKVSYVGGDVRVDQLAADNTTVAYSTIRRNYETVALAGTMSSTPAEFAHWYNSFFSNAEVLNAAAPWATGASYLKFTQTNLGDRYNVLDCDAPSTTDANVTPCAAATTLNSALTTGLPSDATTYHLSDGTIGSVGGVPVWVASAARPQSVTYSTTVQYRIYFQLNGNVYTGVLIKDGTQMGGSSYVSNPGAVMVIDRLTFLPFHIRMNKAAHDSLVNAMKI